VSWRRLLPNSWQARVEGIDLYQPTLSSTVRKARGSAPGPRWRQGLQTSISLKI
jgi:hypothetical protein